MYELRKASNDFKFQMEEELRNVEEADRRTKDNAQLQALALAAPAGAVEASQVPESGHGAPTVTEEGATVTTTESPYPGEEQYPPIDPEVASETPAEEIVEKTAPQAPAAADASSPAAAETSPAEGQIIDERSPGQTPTEPVKENG